MDANRVQKEHQMKLSSPYLVGNDWYRGTLHVHTDNSPCGHYPVTTVRGLYADQIMRYDFIAITDHLMVTPPPPSDDGFIVFSGEEFKRKHRQLLGIDIRSVPDDPDDLDNHQKIIDAVGEQEGLCIICHPHLYTDDYWPVEELLKLSGYCGIEIYNHNERMNNAGRAIATDVWDTLLSSGKTVWGFAGDDMHHVSRLGGGFLMVQAEDRTKQALMQAIRTGSFYASTGAFFRRIEIVEHPSDGQALRLELDAVSSKESEVLLIGDGGKLLGRQRGMKDMYIPLHDPGTRYPGIEGCTYLRLELHRPDGACAWSQPFSIARHSQG